MTGKRIISSFFISSICLRVRMKIFFALQWTIRESNSFHISNDTIAEKDEKILWFNCCECCVNICLTSRVVLSCFLVMSSRMNIMYYIFAHFKKEFRKPSLKDAIYSMSAYTRIKMCYCLYKQKEEYESSESETTCNVWYSHH